MTSSSSSARFALGSFSFAGSAPFAGLVLLPGEQVIALEALRPLCSQLGHALPEVSSTLAVAEQWDHTLPTLLAAARSIGSGESAEARRLAELLVPMSSLKVHPPIASRQILLSGANYFKHVVDMIVGMGPSRTPGAEGMNEQQLRSFAEELMHKRQTEGVPYIFSKPVSAMSGAFDPIAVPDWAKQPDWELELVVVIGKAGRHIRRENAMDHVAGYTIANDITNRDWIFTKADLKAMGTDWISAKSCPTYLPVGPYIVPSFQVENPHALQIELKLNGQTMQDESTSDMIFGVARLVEHISSVVQLLPGDMICTGSPAGNGTHYNRFLTPGDVVEGSITGLGTQRTPVIAEVVAR